MRQPPSGPPPEGPEPSGDPPPGLPGPAQPYGGWQPPRYGPPPQYGAPPYGQPYGPPPARDRRGLVVGLVAGFVPVCKEFHRVNDGTLKTLAGDGKAEVVYHPIVIFSQEPLAGNSTRASAAAHRVTGGAEWLSFQDELFLHQPPEGSSGFDAEDLVSYGSAAGVRGAGFASCVRTQRYAAQVRQASATAIAAGIVGTPTVKVNGTALPTNETLTAEALRNAVIAAG